MRRGFHEPSPSLPVWTGDGNARLTGVAKGLKSLNVWGTKGGRVSGEVTETDLESATRYAVRRQRNLRIPMADGVTLAADLFLPDTPGRYPVVMEYLPYRKNDTTWQGYFGHRYFAE